MSLKKTMIAMKFNGINFLQKFLNFFIISAMVGCVEKKRKLKIGFKNGQWIRKRKEFCFQKRHTSGNVPCQPYSKKNVSGQQEAKLIY